MFMLADKNVTNSVPASLGPCRSLEHQPGRVKPVALLLWVLPFFLCKGGVYFHTGAWLVCRRASGFLIVIQMTCS